MLSIEIEFWANAISCEATVTDEVRQRIEAQKAGLLLTTPRISNNPVDSPSVGNLGIHALNTGYCRQTLQELFRQFHYPPTFSSAAALGQHTPAHCRVECESHTTLLDVNLQNRLCVCVYSRYLLFTKIKSRRPRAASGLIRATPVNRHLETLVKLKMPFSLTHRCSARPPPTSQHQALTLLLTYTHTFTPSQLPIRYVPHQQLALLRRGRRGDRGDRPWGRRWQRQHR